MRILAVNHTAAVSGAELSLMRLLSGLRERHTLAVACPAAGELPRLVDEAGLARLEIPPFEASLRLHPTQTPLGLAQLAASGVAVTRVARRFAPDVVHANSLRAGLMAAIARRLGCPPVVVRAHEHPPASALGRGVRSVLRRSARAVAAVSRHTAEGFNEGLARPIAVVVYNSIDRQRFDPERVRPAPIREQLGIPSGAPLLGQIAQITPWKGQDTAVRTVAGLRRAGVEAHLLLIGEVTFAGKSVRYDNQAFRGRLGELVEELGLGGAVHFLGRRPDVPELLAALDLSLLPSWNEPFGMVTVESMAMGTPPLVSAVGAGPELVEDRVCGRLLDPERPEAWAAAARELLADRVGMATMGANGREVARRFGDDRQAAEMEAIYARTATWRG
jgi:glycosyltransferase involved in cell wall biosynthesis